VSHIVKLSSLDVEQPLAIGAWHEKGEDAIRAASVPFTFVPPTGFMSNLLAWKHSIKAESVVRSSAGQGKRPVFTATWLLSRREL
jgi:(4-alkanoyl-5-oxo-2,5-dihydrofuran-3-yl)methyl phosphate reductase